VTTVFANAAVVATTTGFTSAARRSCATGSSSRADEAEIAREHRRQAERFAA
jgi:hypothetical protein